MGVDGCTPSTGPSRQRSSFAGTSRIKFTGSVCHTISAPGLGRPVHPGAGAQCSVLPRGAPNAPASVSAVPAARAGPA